ncbi:MULTISPECIES: hypothetical protein [Bacillus]|uniref:Uncharacterized protein n=1 Tax=Bacillus glycinifermentans TaxID=1664069 RepID=A0A0T6BN48_9BACI|nr:MULTISPECIES: hypothetical protein [Bacillus]KRT93074.1 hypothetical protein AB447_203840 [Bacillus glycinifermentans]MEC0341945.1 hypothetical protein [Bacillus sonorensis]MEC0457370.1 hypothetical protein [Bacillus sonorensis]MEC0487885.1 hypothetical protein [Bacillus glycinifermentans]MEC0530664.1 hypothetical protein [Bacillus sonorensis]
MTNQDENSTELTEDKARKIYEEFLRIINEIDVTIDEEGMLNEPIIMSLRGEKLKEVYKVLFRDKFFIVSQHIQEFPRKFRADRLLKVSVHKEREINVD